MQKAALAVQLGVGDHGQVIFQTYPVGEPPQGPRQSPKVSVFPGAVQRGRIIIMAVYFALLKRNSASVVM